MAKVKKVTNAMAARKLRDRGITARAKGTARVRVEVLGLPWYITTGGPLPEWCGVWDIPAVIRGIEADPLITMRLRDWITLVRLAGGIK